MGYEHKQPNFEKTFKNLTRVYNCFYNEAEEGEKRFEELKWKENLTEEEKEELYAIPGRLDQLQEEIDDTKCDLQNRFDELNDKKNLNEEEQEEIESIKNYLEIE